MLGFKPALTSKGLRPDNLPLFVVLDWLQASPEFKGIKTIQYHDSPPSSELQASPEFKGIKTSKVVALASGYPLQASPEFKGIKTLRHHHEAGHLGFKPALNSKGLRHRVFAA